MVDSLARLDHGEVLQDDAVHHHNAAAPLEQGTLPGEGNDPGPWVSQDMLLLRLVAPETVLYSCG